MTDNYDGGRWVSDEDVRALLYDDPERLERFNIISEKALKNIHLEPCSAVYWYMTERNIRAVEVRTRYELHWELGDGT